jgi:hypothetical protein
MAPAAARWLLQQVTGVLLRRWWPSTQPGLVVLAGLLDGPLLLLGGCPCLQFTSSGSGGQDILGSVPPAVQCAKLCTLPRF